MGSADGNRVGRVDGNRTRILVDECERGDICVGMRMRICVGEWRMGRIIRMGTGNGGLNERKEDWIAVLSLPRAKRGGIHERTIVSLFPLTKELKRAKNERVVSKRTTFYFFRCGVTKSLNTA